MGKTSSEVKNRWNAKTYKRYTLSLRREEDAELISYIDEQATKGLKVSELVRESLELYRKNEG